MNQLSDFLTYARERMLTSDETLPCEPEDCAAVMGYLCALVPEYELDRQTDLTGDETRRADRKQAILTGLRKARGAKPPEAAPEAAPASAEAGGTGKAA